eukprot:7391590-Prymnesium_polylepis.1
MMRLSVPRSWTRERASPQRGVSTLARVADEGRTATRPSQGRIHKTRGSVKMESAHTCACACMCACAC